MTQSSHARADVLPRDVVHVSPHLDDAALSSAGWILDDRAAGLSVLVLNVFTEPESERRREEERAARLLDVDTHAAGFLDAAWRHPSPESARASSREPKPAACAGSTRSADPRRPVERASGPRRDVSRSRSAAPDSRDRPSCTLRSKGLTPALVFASEPRERDLLERLIEHVAEVLERARPERLHVPLAAGGHVDHLLAREAALSAARRVGIADVLHVEDRPYVFVREALRLRLAALGLETTAPDLAPRSLPRVAISHVASLATAPFVRPHARLGNVPAGLRGLAATLHAARRTPVGAAVPVTRTWPTEIVERIRDVAACHASQFPDMLGSLDDFVASTREYSRRLGHPGAHAERAWRLPDAGALDEIPPPSRVSGERTP